MRQIVSAISEIAGNLMASIAQAYRQNVPIVMGANAESAPDSRTQPSDLYKQLVAVALAASPRRNFARGGPIGTDRVAAWLTPGEWVIPREAVQRYGASLLSAMNSMRISPQQVSTMIAPPRVQRFAQGGMVQGSPGEVRRHQAPAGVAAAAPQPIININAAAGDILSSENVRRFIEPVLRDNQRRSR